MIFSFFMCHASRHQTKRCKQGRSSISSNLRPFDSSSIIIIIILQESIDPLVSFSNQSYPSNMFEKKKRSLPNFSPSLPRLAGGWIIFATFTIWSWSLIGLYMLLSGLMTLAARFQGARFRGSNRLFAHTHTCL